MCVGRVCPRDFFIFLSAFGKVPLRLAREVMLRDVVRLRDVRVTCGCSAWTEACEAALDALAASGVLNVVFVHGSRIH
jgi:hypothetical protein